MTNPLPQYRCHKVVRATKIARIDMHTPPPSSANPLGDPQYLLHPEDVRLKAIEVDAAWATKNQPKPGGYVVRYEDGYTSFSPAKAFEEGYTPVDGDINTAKQFDFGLAICHMKAGRAVARAGWNGKGMSIYLNPGSRPAAEKRSHIDGVSRAHFTLGDDGTVTRMPNFNMRTATGTTVTGWLASQTDLLAEDWTLAP